MYSIRPFGEPDLEADYRLLHLLSNYQVPQDPAGNLVWQRNRREYDETQGMRRHYVALHQAETEPIGYAAIEQQREGLSSFRLFLVFDPGRWAYEELGEFLYQRLFQEARELCARKLAFVEYASDLPFLTFLELRGFVRVWEGSYNGFPIVRLELALDGAAA